MRRILIGTLSTTLLFSFAIAARTMGTTPSEVVGLDIAQRPSCSNPQTQTQINTCAGIDYENAERRMNQVYQQLLPQLPVARRQRLVASQQAWLRFRENSCEFQRSEVAGGTMAPTVYNSCMAEMAKQRTQQLEAYMRTGM